MRQATLSELIIDALIFRQGPSVVSLLPIDESRMVVMLRFAERKDYIACLKAGNRREDSMSRYARRDATRPPAWNSYTTAL